MKQVFNDNYFLKLMGVAFALIHSRYCADGPYLLKPRLLRPLEANQCDEPQDLCQSSREINIFEHPAFPCS